MQHEIGYWFFIRYPIFFCVKSQTMATEDMFFHISTYIH